MSEALEPILDQLSSFFRLVNEPILHVSGSRISIASLLVSALVIYLATKLAKLAGNMVRRSLEARAVDRGVRDSLVKFVHYLVVAIGILFSLDNLGISINSLAALGAVLMVGIGFGLQNIAQNFISGIILLIERPIKVGDQIKVGGTAGRVMDIRVRSTIIQTADDTSIIVPNSKLISEEVVNTSFTSERIRQHVRVGAAYGSDIAKVKALLIQAAASHASVLKDPAPAVIFEEFADSSLNFDLRYWSALIWDTDQISSDIRTTIDKLFREAGIEIPFPQREIHMKGADGIGIRT